MEEIIEEIIELLSLYQGSPKKFNKLVRSKTLGKFTGEEVINLAKETLENYKAKLNMGILRYVRGSEDLLSILKLSKHLIGTHVYRMWNGGKHGKICIGVEIKNISISADSVVLITQAKYSNNFKNPVTRELKLSDLGLTWFLTPSDCRKAIERS